MLPATLRAAFLAMQLPLAQAGDDLFPLKGLLAPPLQARTLKSSEKDGIVTEEVMFHSEKDGDKSVDIFAYFSYPKGAKGLPAFVWNQGGLYKATTFWTEFGARRGYATLCIDFPIPGYRSTGGYPINSGLDLPTDPRKAPIYHGAVALLRAVSFLEARPQVDKNRIGMAGSSWGGFFTTLMAGIDPRLKACSSMFGCGNLHLGNAWWDGGGKNPMFDPIRDRWRTTLDPAWRLPRSKTPIAWFTGSNDHFYWLPAVMKSHDMAGGPRHLSILPNWNHALTPEIDDQVFAWLDVHLKRAPGFLEAKPLELVKNGALWQARWKFAGPRKAARAELHLSNGAAGNWESRCWKTYPAKIDGDACTAAIPGGKLSYHLIGSVIDDAGYRYSTPMLLVEPARFFPDGKPDLGYNGAGDWGGFEEGQVAFIRLHGYPLPALSDDARSGKKAALLKPGKTTLPPLLFTGGISHRFSAFAKAEKESTIKLELLGQFSKTRMEATKEFTVGPAWTEMKLDSFPIGDELTASIRAVLTVPKGAEVLVDEVSFRPLP